MRGKEEFLARGYEALTTRNGDAPLQVLHDLPRAKNWI